MKEKKKLYDAAMELLEGCNTTLKDDPQLHNINSRLSLLIRDLSDILVKTLTGNDFPNDQK